MFVLGLLVSFAYSTHTRLNLRQPASHAHTHDEDILVLFLAELCALGGLLASSR